MRPRGLRCTKRYNERFRGRRTHYASANPCHETFTENHGIATPYERHAEQVRPGRYAFIGVRTMRYQNRGILARCKRYAEQVRAGHYLSIGQQ